MARGDAVTERGYEVLAALLADGSRSTGGRSTYRRARERLGIKSDNALFRHLVNLEKRGLIVREPKKHRCIRDLPAGIAALTAFARRPTPRCKP